MTDDRDLAEAILAEIASDNIVAETMTWWQHLTDDNIGGSETVRWKVILHAAAHAAIAAVLARRQREAARTGPWDGTP